MDLEGDMTLVERLVARDEEALREAIETYGGVVFGMAKRIVNDPNLAEEVAQDTFLSLWRRPGAFDSRKGALGSFLVGVARNKSVDLVRREESVRRRRDSLAAEFGARTVVDSSEDGLGSVDDREQVKDALTQLSDMQREAVVLAYFGGRTYREVAVELGVPEGTAKTRLRDGLLRLRQLLASEA
ncbi:MAG: RNA polymerase sigma factor [Actinomycetota bacterium]